MLTIPRSPGWPFGKLNAFDTKCLLSELLSSPSDWLALHPAVGFRAAGAISLGDFSSFAVAFLLFPATMVMW